MGIVLGMVAILTLIVTLSLSHVQADFSAFRPLALSQLLAQDDNLLGQSDYQGCGPNPLVKLFSDMPIWLQRTMALTSSQDMSRTIRSDGTILREFMEFKRILRRFKDCVKTGDGIRAKKSFELL